MNSPVLILLIYFRPAKYTWRFVWKITNKCTGRGESGVSARKLSLASRARPANAFALLVRSDPFQRSHHIYITRTSHYESFTMNGVGYIRDDRSALRSGRITGAIASGRFGWQPRVRAPPSYTCFPEAADEMHAPMLFLPKGDGIDCSNVSHSAA